MNEKNYFTIVVPLSPDAQKIVQGNPSAVPLRAAVWSQAVKRLSSYKLEVFSFLF